MRPYLIKWRDRPDKPMPVLAHSNASAKLRAVEHRFGPQGSYVVGAMMRYGRMIQSCRQWAGPAEECVNASPNSLRILGTGA
jgi:hypothetical protein